MAGGGSQLLSGLHDLVGTAMVQEATRLTNHQDRLGSQRGRWCPLGYVVVERGVRLATYKP